MKTKIWQLVLTGLLLNSCGIPIGKDMQVYSVATVTQPNVEKTGSKSDFWATKVDYQTDSLYHLRGIMNVDVGSPIASKLCKGDKFVMVYDKSDPTNYIVYSDKPVFTDDEPFVETTGTITRVSPLAWDAGVEYTYPVKDTDAYSMKEDTVITNFQEVASMIGEKSRRRQFPNLGKGNKYVVRYSTVNPQRAVIYLDKPVLPNVYHTPYSY